LKNFLVSFENWIFLASHRLTVLRLAEILFQIIRFLRNTLLWELFSIRLRKVRIGEVGLVRFRLCYIRVGYDQFLYQRSGVTQEIYIKWIYFFSKSWHWCPYKKIQTFVNRSDGSHPVPWRPKLKNQNAFNFKQTKKLNRILLWKVFKQ